MNLGCLRLRLGTVVRPSNLSGRRALFYRDKNGQHRSLQPIDFIRRKLFKLTPPEQMTILTSPKAYRDLLSSNAGISHEDFRGIKSFSGKMRKIIFQEHKAIFESKILGAVIIFWDNGGIYLRQIMREAQSGTIYKQNLNQFEL